MIKDTYELQGFSTPKMPKLKGHVKLILRNHKTGKVEVSEGENIVTNAIADIMALNFLGGVDYSKILGTDGIWKTWFGGVLAFENAHTNLDADKYQMPTSDSNVEHCVTGYNPLIAHAGQTSIDEAHDDDSKRGNPSTSEYYPTDNSMKIVWEWGRQKGNGTIRSLSLCHTDVGSYGTGSTSYGFANNFEPFAVINQVTSFWNELIVQYADVKSVQIMYDDAHALAFYKTDTDEVTVYIRKLSYLKSGLHQTLETSENLQVSFPITTPFNLYAQPYYYFDYVNKYLWLFTNLDSASTYDNDDIRYFVIDCENKALVNLGTTQEPLYYKTIRSDNPNIAPLGMGLTEYANILKIGNYFLFPTSTSPQWSGNTTRPEAWITGYQKINMSDTSDQETIAFNASQQFSQSLMGAGDVFINNGRVINGLTGYSCKQQFNQSGAVYHNLFFSTPDKAISYAQWLKKDAGYTTYINPSRYILANKMLLTTKYNLSQAVQKDANKSMTVEYTLTEVSGNE